ncbi:MAG: cardiolipin synthase [Phycisphaerae bacterium]
MAQLWGVAIAVNYALALLTVTHILRRRKDPPAMLAWIFAVLTLPVVGMLLYLLLGDFRIRRKARRRRRRIAHLIGVFTRQAERASQAGDEQLRLRLAEDLAAVEEIGRRLAHMPAIGGNAVRILREANETYESLEEAIAGARRHVHLLYYIWQNDATGRHFRDLLCRKAREGVECRLLLDAVGCWGLRRSFLQPLRDAGVQVAFFLPLYPLRRRWSLHLRNHRKIAVVDSQVSFLGSQNIGDEYRGRLKRLSPWYDSHMRIDGPASLFLQQIFAEDWSFATQEGLDPDVYFQAPERRGDCVVQILPTGPDQDVSVLGQLVFAAVSCAHSSIRIETPYFVPDPALLMALQYACTRGVRVQIVLPTRSDAPLVLWCGRSFYVQLLEAGVEIYEFDGGVLHSKTICVDERWCMLSSANMDIRSFRLNFEVSALIYDAGLAGALGESIDRHVAASRRIALRDARTAGVARQMAEGAARLFAPLL